MPREGTSLYPGALDDFNAPSNGATKLGLPGDASRKHGDLHADVGAAIEAMQAELGLSPSGAEATVAARLALLDAPFRESTLAGLPVAPAVGTTRFITDGDPATGELAGAHLYRDGEWKPVWGVVVEDEDDDHLWPVARGHAKGPDRLYDTSAIFRETGDPPDVSLQRAPGKRNDPTYGKIFAKMLTTVEVVTPGGVPGTLTVDPTSDHIGKTTRMEAFTTAGKLVISSPSFAQQAVLSYTSKNGNSFEGVAFVEGYSGTFAVGSSVHQAFADGATPGSIHARIYSGKHGCDGPQLFSIKPTFGDGYAYRGPDITVGAGTISGWYGAGRVEIKTTPRGPGTNHEYQRATLGLDERGQLGLLGGDYGIGTIPYRFAVGGPKTFVTVATTFDGVGDPTVLDVEDPYAFEGASGGSPRTITAGAVTLTYTGIDLATRQLTGCVFVSTTGSNDIAVNATVKYATSQLLTTIGTPWDASFRDGLTSQVKVGAMGPAGEAGVSFGSSNLFTFYRAGNNELRTVSNNLLRFVGGGTNVVLAELSSGQSFDRWALINGGDQRWGAGTAAWDVMLGRSLAGVLKIEGSGTGAALEYLERADPAAPGADRARVYAKDNGSGKTQLVVRFPTGAVQVLATEP